MLDAKMMDVALQSFGRPACEVNVKKGQEDDFLEACWLKRFLFLGLTEDCSFFFRIRVYKTLRCTQLHGGMSSSRVRTPLIEVSQINHERLG